MFTGLITSLGTLREARAAAGQTRLSVEIAAGWDDLVLGESIATSGVCLTVESAAKGRFTAYASAETLSKTTLGEKKPGQLLNLERALRPMDRLGGHIVAGHVDCVAVVASLAPAGESVVYTLRFPAEFAPYVVEKGSVTLDGISLTVNSVTADTFSVNIIPSTQRETTIHTWKQGSRVNLEVDVLGKYVAKMLGLRELREEDQPEALSMNRLRELGF